MGRNALFADLRALDNLGLAAQGTPITLVASDHATVTQHESHNPFLCDTCALAYDEPFADDDDDPDAQVAAMDDLHDAATCRLCLDAEMRRDRADLINERIERDEASSAYESYIARLADADDRGWSRRMDSLERKMILAEQRGDRVAFLGMMNRLARGDV